MPLRYSIQYDRGETVIGHLEQVRSGLADLSPLANQIGEIITEDVQAARLEGVDRDGVALAPLNHGQPLTPRQIVRRGGDGPPLAPRGSGSRVVTRFTIEIFSPRPWQWFINGSWPGLYWLKYHGSDPEWHSRFLPVRDIVGVRPAAHERIIQISSDYISSLVSP